jgi:membrane-bound lytic murein transglycosylase D
MVVKSVFLAGSLAALLALAGCPSQPGSAVRPPAKATAPPLARNSASPQQAAPAPQPQEILAEEAAAKARRDSELIASVEKAYHAGLDNYQQGQLAAARANFDYAVDLMLRCHCDIHQDQAVSAEFDRIVDAVNTLEMDALRQGGVQNGQAEPSPVDVAGNITTPASPAIAAQAAAELRTTRSDLPLVTSAYGESVIDTYIDFFENNPRGHATIVASLERMGRYKAMIERVLRQAGLPQDLIYQAVAESGFRPQIVNRRSGAGGMWQFMPYGNYGLEHNAWVDQRFDPVESTEAYAREIKKDYDQLGDWYLAMAAYDWGAGNVQRAVERTGYVDFWQLYQRNNLPQETKNYVPVILAVTIMAKNPKQYGLADITPNPPLVTDTVTTDYEVSLRLVADIVCVPVQEIEALNPSLLRMSTPPDQSFDLNLPAGTGPLFQKEIAEIPVDKRRFWRMQTVKPGDTLASVARTWHVSPSELAFVNQLGPASDLSGVDSLVIPEAPSSEPRALRGAVYRIRRGDTLITIADRFGVTLEQLRRWNRLRGNEIFPGHILYVAEPAHIYTRLRYRRYRPRRRTDPHSRRKTTSASHPRSKKSTG